MSLTIRLTNNFGKIAAELAPKAKQINSKIAHDIEAEAKQLAPIRDGGLRGSIETIEDGDINYAVVVGVAYGARIEFGFNGADALGRVYNQAAHPYLTPAAEHHRAAHLAALAKLVG